MPTLELESSLPGIVVGVDEVGRGCLCLDVVAAAVHIPDPSLLEGPLRGVRDSKKLSKKSREALDAAIRETCVVAVGSANAEEVDRLNVLQATFLAMTRAVEAFSAAFGCLPDHAIVDGNRLPKAFPCPASTLVKGDSLSASVAAASIVAKVARDRQVVSLHEAFPAYGWDRNAGYGTPEHLAALREHGPTIHHRRTFAGVTPVLTPQPSHAFLEVVATPAGR